MKMKKEFFESKSADNDARDKVFRKAPWAKVLVRVADGWWAFQDADAAQKFARNPTDE